MKGGVILWKAVHIYYYQDEKEGLLLDAVRPVVQKLRDRYQVKHLYLKRHWKFGPHIALLVDVSESEFEALIFPYIEKEITAYLHKHPSAQEIDPIAYLKQSETLGAWELEPGPYHPLQPDNSICVRPVASRADVVNGVEVAELIEKFMIDSVDVLFSVLEASRGNLSQRYAILIQMMAVIGQMYPDDGIVRGHLSYRSHVEGFLHSFDQEGKVRQVFMENERGMRETVDWLVQDVIDHTAEDGTYEGPSPLLQSWSDLLYKLYQDAFPLAQEGKIHSDTSHYKELADQIGEQARERWSLTGDQSEFHQHLQSEEEGLRVLNSPEFATYRMLVNNFYSLLPLFGISPNVKHLLCFLVANSVERIKNVTWQELMGYQKGESTYETKT